MGCEKEYGYEDSRYEEARGGCGCSGKDRDNDRDYDRGFDCDEKKGGHNHKDDCGCKKPEYEWECTLYRKIKEPVMKRTCGSCYPRPKPCCCKSKCRCGCGCND